MDYLLKQDKFISRQLAICADPTTPWKYLRLCFRLLELSFHGIPWLIYAIVAIFMVKAERTSYYVNLLAALILDLLVSLVVKVTVRRPRPSYHHSKDFLVSVKIDKKFSFPSGHTTRAIMCGCLLLYSLELSFLSQILVLTWSISTAVSRVMLGRHYVTDVIAGSIFGFLQFYAMVHYLHIDERTCQSIAKHCQSLLSRS